MDLRKIAIKDWIPQFADDFRGKAKKCCQPQRKTIKKNTDKQNTEIKQCQ